MKTDEDIIREPQDQSPENIGEPPKLQIYNTDQIEESKSGNRKQESSYNI